MYRCCLFLFISILLSYDVRLKAQSPDSRDYVADIVAHAKQQGKQTAEIPPLQITPTGINSLEDLAKDYSCVVATPIQMIPQATKTGIDTWVKFRTDETIIEQNQPDSADTSSSIPAALLPLKPGEFAVALSGGKTVKDGISVTQQNPHHLAFALGRSYLLFLYFELSGTRATVASLENGVFSVDQDGKLAPVGTSGHSVAKRISNDFHANIEYLRPAIRQLQQELQNQ